MLILILISLIKHANSNLRSIGGREAVPDEYPYVVSMEYAFEIQGQDLYMQVCSGSALTHTWTLTAAHCITRILVPFYKKTVLRYGGKEKPLRSDVTKTVVHKSYVQAGGHVGHDIALVQSEVLKISSFARLSAVDYSTLVGSAAISAGYGIGLNDSNKQIQIFGDSERPLQLVEVMIAKCDAGYITPALCSTPKCGNRAYLCPGDSGGPVIHSSGVIAVHTFGYRNRRAKKLPDLKGIYKYVGIDTPVSPYTNWILGEMANAK